MLDVMRAGDDAHGMRIVHHNREPASDLVDREDEAPLSGRSASRRGIPTKRSLQEKRAVSASIRGEREILMSSSRCERAP